MAFVGSPKVGGPQLRRPDESSMSTGTSSSVVAQPALALGIDIGGTKIAGGAIASDGTVVARARAETPHRSTVPRVVEDTIMAVVQDLLSQVGADHVLALGVGAAGFVAADRATVVFAPHLSWRHEPLRDTLTARTGLPVVVDNDANASAWAESRFGAATGSTDFVMVNLGTGIGGAILIEGELYRGQHGMAGEFGHMQVAPDGLICECGNRGCWEQYASGRALVREARALIEAASPVAVDLGARVDGDARAITGPMITQAAIEGDALSRDLLADIGAWLGIGLSNLAAAFDPQLFVIGGGVSAAGELLLAPAREAFRRRLPGRGYRPEPTIVHAVLGNDAGFIGAADLARQAVTSRGPSA